MIPRTVPEHLAVLDGGRGSEGRIHFAGEHASSAHAWIQGTIESGIRAAAEIYDGRRSRTAAR